jgi:hypothetical protein
LTSRFATPIELIPLEHDKHGHHLPSEVAKSWKTLEHVCRNITEILCKSFTRDHPKIFLNCSAPPLPSKFGYFDAHSTEKKARSALSKSIDAFVLLFAYVSFCIAICRDSRDPLSISLSSSTKPKWFQELSARKNRIHPEFLQLLADSPISQFTSTTPQRLGTIINVSQCPWVHLVVPYLLKANVPIWLYWGIPPVFVQPLENTLLLFAPRSHPQSRAPPISAIAPSQSVLPTPSQPVCLPVRSVHGGPAQLPGETWKDFMKRQNDRRMQKISKENDADRQMRVGRENSAAGKSCPGKKGPAVYIWEDDDGVWTRTLLTRGQVNSHWSNYRSSQRIFNSIDNCWDLCEEFDAGTRGQMYEYDSNDSDDDTYRPQQSRQSSRPENGRSGDGSACPPIVVDAKSDCTPMDVDPGHLSRTPQSSSHDPAPQAVPTPAQVASDCTPMLIDSRDPAPQSVPTLAQVASDFSAMLVDSRRDLALLPLSIPLQKSNPQSEGDFIDPESDEDDLYDASKQDVLNAYSFVALDLEEMPVTTLDDILYYRYGFSLSEHPYTGIPSSVTMDGTRPFRGKWKEICASVGGLPLESSAVTEDRAAIEDFLSILSVSLDPFNDVPGIYWDLRSENLGIDNVFISIEERQLNDGKKNDKHYIIRPRFLHPSRDTSWLLSVDSMTALECIRRGLGPHTIDIANFLISHGVRFHALQLIPNSPKLEQPPVRPSCRYLGYRPVGYFFDEADFVGYESLRDSFFLAQSHGPLALRQGGVIARLAREVLPNSNALSGPSSEALSGRRARFSYGGDSEIYVDDKFSEAELGLICGTYALYNPKSRGK